MSMLGMALLTFVVIVVSVIALVTFLVQAQDPTPRE